MQRKKSKLPRFGSPIAIPEHFKDIPEIVQVIEGYNDWIEACNDEINHPNPNLRVLEILEEEGKLISKAIDIITAAIQKANKEANP